ncbi:alpha/beta hydrolase fold domain-containing protein [Exiguobacterium artemiae]
MKRETAWLMGGAAILTTAAAGASIWNNYGALLRWTEPALPLSEVQLAPRTILFKTVDQQELKLDLYYPPGDGPFPVAIYAHGGAFVRGNRDDVFCFTPIVERFLELGIAVCSIDYRLFEDGSYFPDNLEDVRDALCFLNQEADDLRIMRGRMVLWGDSAGAALMLTTALSPMEFIGEQTAESLPLISGVIALYPPTNFLLFKFIQTWIAHIKFYGGGRDEWRELMTRVSPVTHLTADSPPIMLLHGKKIRLFRLRKRSTSLKKEPMSEPTSGCFPSRTARIPWRALPRPKIHSKSSVYWNGLKHLVVRSWRCRLGRPFTKKENMIQSVIFLLKETVR